MQKIKSLMSDPLLVKAFHTFWQGFLSVFLFSYSDVLHAFQNGGLNAGKTALLALLVAAGAAGLSALKTLVVSYFSSSVMSDPTIDSPAPIDIAPQA